MRNTVGYGEKNLKIRVIDGVRKVFSLLDACSMCQLSLKDYSREIFEIGLNIITRISIFIVYFTEKALR